MSLEHIWPQSLGGRHSDALFQTREVCRTCNSLAGLWVDGAFLKSWFISNEASLVGRSYMDPSKPGVTLLTYMGIDQEFPVETQDVCERWVGPTGGHVYHIHLKDDDKWYGFAGGDVIRRRIDGGRAYLILTSKSSYWALSAIMSFMAHFRGVTSRLFCLTRVEGMPEELSSEFVDETCALEMEIKEINWIRARPDGKMVMMGVSVRLDFSDRFLAKLALGLGANILGSRYLTSDYATKLRKLLWIRDPKEKAELNVRGTNYLNFENMRGVSEIIKREAAWTIMLMAQKNDFLLLLCTPNGRGMSIVISDDATLWQDESLKEYHFGVMYFVVPERECFIGPVSLPDLLAYRLHHRSQPKIAYLESLRGDPSLLPPMRQEQ